MAAVVPTEKKKNGIVRKKIFFQILIFKYIKLLKTKFVIASLHLFRYLRISPSYLIVNVVDYDFDFIQASLELTCDL